LQELAEKRFGSADEQRRARQAFVESIIGDEDEYIDDAANVMWDAIDTFAQTVPTTVAGLLAMLIYAKEVADRGDCDAFDDAEIFSTLATAAKACPGGRREAGAARFVFKSRPTGFLNSASWHVNFFGSI
jgi:hypothetical protein